MKKQPHIEKAMTLALKKVKKRLQNLFGCSSISIVEHFSDVTDPRSDQGKRHPLLSVIVIALCAVICGADGWTEIEEFGKNRQEWLESFLDLPHGIPIEDTYRRVFAALDPDEFRQRFSKWIQTSIYLKEGSVVAIDGKTLRGCKGEGISKKHIVNAWASSSKITLGQVAVGEKSNEITAIPELLKQLSITGCIVTIDAMGCQTKIASMIRSKEAHYILALKGNQGTLEKDVDAHFQKELLDKEANLQAAETLEKDHGRIERRKCWVTSAEGLNQKGKWKDLKSLIRIESERTIKGKTSKEIRYYISSSQATPAEFLSAIRAHWGIENGLHWVLDVAFKEDACRIRKENSPENFNILRHVTLHLLNQEKGCKRGVKTKRFNAACNVEYLEKVLIGPENVA